jgi:ankyrin repeat protein
MQPECAKLIAAATLVVGALHGQEPVCDLFKDLKAADGRQLVVTGALIISKDFAAIGAGDCENQYTSNHFVWPTALRLRPSATIPAEQIRRFRNAATEADHLRRDGKAVSASASFNGRVHLGEAEDLPGEFMFDSINDLKVEALHDAGELAVMPICELFQNLTTWKGQRIAVRGEVVGTSEGSWLRGRCKGGFYTNGYRWPVSLSYAGPAYYSTAIAPLIRVKQPTTPPKGFEAFRGRYNVVKYATYVGRLRLRDEYIAVCRESGDYLTNGFGHLSGAAAEIVVEEIRDVELAKTPADEVIEEEHSCQPPNLSALCPIATLSRAAALGCTTRVTELLSKDGIDSKDGNASEALSQSIRTGNEAIVKLLLNAGAPVNPLEFRVWSPLGEAAHWRKLDIMKTLLTAGAKVDALDHQGATYLAGYGFFDTQVLKILLDAGANPNAGDSSGRTALMQASNYGYEDAVLLLIDHGAIVNQKDYNGSSALMYAANGKYVDAISRLLGHGADVYARDLDGKTALDLARASRNEDAAELILSARQGRR